MNFDISMMTVVNGMKAYLSIKFQLYIYMNKTTGAYNFPKSLFLESFDLIFINLPYCSLTNSILTAISPVVKRLRHQF